VFHFWRIYNQSHSVKYINILTILFRSHIDSLDFMLINSYSSSYYSNSNAGLR
jgi:hypothetical protein